MDAPLVLDTSALLSGRPVRLAGATYVPPEVLDEMRRPGASARNLEYLLAAGLAVRAATPGALAAARAAAERTGDLPRLSRADLAVLALAVDLGARIATDDYRVQNVAVALGIAHEGRAERGITEAWTWVYRCNGCRRVHATDPGACPVCGAATRAVRARPGQKP
ncbi:MAG TPA: NOB1 family endonuclease [Candidatus Thermoplasmatota archaeon]|nr:NOB1 family endonuclease [Candidatus Thermoplasmatota archaeon]